MSVYDEIALRSQLIELRVHALLAGGLDLTLVAVVLYLYHHQLLRGKSLISPAAGSDEEFLVAESGAYVSPGPGDEAGLHQSQA